MLKSLRLLLSYATWPVREVASLVTLIRRLEKERDALLVMKGNVHAIFEDVMQQYESGSPSYETRGTLGWIMQDLKGALSLAEPIHLWNAERDATWCGESSGWHLQERADVDCQPCLNAELRSRR